MKTAKHFSSLLLVFLYFFLPVNAQQGLTVSKGTPVDQQGLAIFGNPGAYHITIDDDDIQAKSAAGQTYNDLFLNYYGGHVDIASAPGSNAYMCYAGGKVAVGSIDNPTAQLDLLFNSKNLINPHLRLTETESTDFARLDLRNAGSGAFWQLAGRSITDPVMKFHFYDGSTLDTILSLKGATPQVGIGIGTPASVLHIKQNADGADDGIRLEASDGSRWNTYVDTGDDYHLAFDGTGKAYINDTDGAYTTESDRRLKTDIRPLQPVLERVLKLRPAWYRFRDARSNTLSLGFIAQEVEEQFPELVAEKDGLKGLTYDHFGVLAIRAIQEMNEELNAAKAHNRELEAQNEQLAERTTRLEARLAQLEQHLTACCENTKGSGQPGLQEIRIADQPRLEQNFPNPFSKSTVIRYYLPAGTGTAILRITDLSGREVAAYPLQGRGEGQVAVEAGRLSAGTYLYTLVLDGAVSDTRQMVLTQQ